MKSSRLEVIINHCNKKTDRNNTIYLATNQIPHNGALLHVNVHRADDVRGGGAWRAHRTRRHDPVTVYRLRRAGVRRQLNYESHNSIKIHKHILYSAITLQKTKTSLTIYTSQL